MRIERVDDAVFFLLTPFGTVRVSDNSGYRSYYIDNPASNELALALSLLGVNVADAKRGVPNGEVGVNECVVAPAINDTKIGLHCSKGARGRVERLLDEIFCIDEENWRKA